MYFSLQVFNSKKLRSDALIGNFQLDVGTIYEEDDHCFLNKWLLLTNADDAQAGPRGYLQVSMSVLTTGEDAQVSTTRRTFGERWVVPSV